ncbi:MAG: glycosyltransferase [Opitutales bacterium]|nr:glycosyltransferase [Opitutales bacterium]
MVNPPRSLTNAGEQVLGIGFALSHWSTFRQRPPDRFHAVWATGPATAALLLSKLTGIPFSMEAHAYDMYRRGGDCLLFSKMRKAEFIRTSTHAGATELVRRGADPGKVHLIRRGLVDFPPGRQKTSRQGPLRLLSVGRLVPKKGFHFLLDIASALAARDVDFHLRLIGDGPLWNSLQEKICKAGLSSNVSLSGKLPMEEVWRSHHWADFYLFTGQVAADGDRDGFPNVLGEAMASGAVILSTGVAGTSEGVQDRVTGRLLPFGTPEPWIEALLELKEDPEQQESFQTKARHWVQQNFDAHRNAGELGRLHRTFLTA